MSPVERFFYVAGIGAVTISSVVLGWGLLCFLFDRWRHRREQQQAIAALIRSARVASWWMHPVEPRGRG